MVEFDAVVLAGGRGQRLGGVDKARLKVGGVPLLERVLAACEGARTRVVVGPVEAPEEVLVTREDPPGTGPAAGLVAGLDAIAEPAEWTLALACDLPGAGEAVPQLLAAVGERDAYCLTRRDGGAEWLLALYRTTALRHAVEAYGDPRNRSIRGMVGSLDPVLVAPADAHDVDDLDTWADHARWNKHLRAAAGAGREPEDRTPWRPFIEAACAAVGVDPDLVDEDAILDLTREVAHAGARPMAPVAAHVMGLAVGRGADAEHTRRVLEDVATAAPVPPEEELI